MIFFVIEKSYNKYADRVNNVKYNWKRQNENHQISRDTLLTVEFVLKLLKRILSFSCFVVVFSDVKMT